MVINNYNPTFVIGISPRCGSTFVVNQLQQSGLYDRPVEIETNYLLEMHQTKQWMTTYHWKQYWVKVFLNLCLKSQPIFKTPLPIHCTLLREVFPSCDIITIERDCRNVLYSTLRSHTEMYRKSGLDINDEIYTQMRHRMEYWDRVVIHMPNTIRLIYEELIEDPIYLFEDLCNKLNRPFDEGGLSPNLVFGSCMFEEQDQWKWRIEYKPNNFSPNDRWRMLTSHQLDKYYKYCGEMHDKLGYRR